MTEGKLVEDIRGALGHVMDPELNRDLVTLGMVKDISVEGGRANVTIELTTPACPLKSRIEADVKAAVTGVPGVEAADVNLTAKVRGAPGPEDDPIPDVKNTIAVASGKGGVGKSAVAVNLAVALAEEGAAVGLLDCDIYGPSVPKMTGTDNVAPSADDVGFRPVERYGIKLMSIGYLVPPGHAVVWRGPLIHKAVQQFLNDVLWGDLDYLVIDLPPGTGDAQLSLTQTIPLTGAVMVTTPQPIALIDVEKGIDMFRKVNVPICGIIENMSTFCCPNCGHETDIFDRGGGKRIAETLGVPFLGEIPIDLAVRVGGDSGTPSMVSHPDAASSKAFLATARTLAGQVSQVQFRKA